MEKTELGFNINKALVKDAVIHFREDVLQNRIDPTTAGVVIKKAEKFIKDLYSGEEGAKLKEHIVNHTKEHLDDLTTEHGIKGNYTSVHAAYDYKKCGHPSLEKLYEIQKQVKNEIKIIETELQQKYKQFQEPEFIDGKVIVPKKEFNIIIQHDFSLSKVENGEEAVTVNIPEKFQKYGIKYTGIK